MFASQPTKYPPGTEGHRMGHNEILAEWSGQ